MSGRGGGRGGRRHWGGRQHGRGGGRGDRNFEGLPSHFGRGHADRRRGGGRRGFRGGRGGGRGLEVAVSEDLTYIREIPLPSTTKTNANNDCAESPPLRVAIQGCAHGQLNRIYDTLEEYTKSNSAKIDLLLCCGDFESLRDVADLETMAVPLKYREMGSFYEYYSGKRVAPVLTIFVGGNHEASAYLQELRYGGWVAPNIYYLGAAGVVNVGGLRIAGISGIYKSHDYHKGIYERPPYNQSTLRSVYHVRATDVYRMKCLGRSETTKSSAAVDIMISHDWPRGIEQHGDKVGLVRKKRHFQDEIRRNELGSPANEEVLLALRPLWWFAAHLHVRFEATMHHQLQETTSKPAAKEPLTEEPDDIKPAATTSSSSTTFLGLESADSCNANGTMEDLSTQMTRFLSLDKCLPRRHYMEIVHLPRKRRLATRHSDQQDGTLDDSFHRALHLEYDLEWLAILKKTHDLTVPSSGRVSLPSHPVTITEEDLEHIRTAVMNHARRRQQKQSTGDASENVQRDGGNCEEKNETLTLANVENYLEIPLNFQITVPPHNGDNGSSPRSGTMLGNPQTDEFLNMLGLNHIVTVPYISGGIETTNVPPATTTNTIQTELTLLPSQSITSKTFIDEDEIDLDDDDEKEPTKKPEKITERIMPIVVDDDEIEIDNDEESVDETCQNNKETDGQAKKARIG